jgi:hypothetical protein
MKIEVRLGEVHKAITELAKYKRDLIEKTKLVVEKLAFLGAVNASLEYARAVADENDVQVNVEWVNETTAKIRATGTQILFIEFGAGITYGYGHPEAKEYGYGAGTFPSNKGHWDDPNGWWYSKDGESKHTYGNPPSASMYNTARKLEQEIERVVKEVFR